MDPHWIAEDILTIDRFLSADECDAYVKLSENKGFEEASVSTHTGMVMMKNLRNNDRVIIDDASLASDLWQRVQPFVPPEFKKWHPVGVNERFRFYRYDVGQKFDWHQDGHFERTNGERSFFTFMVYLNADFEGGETSFSTSNRSSVPWPNLKVKPEIGKALLFHHPITHKGETVVAGRKYVLRSDLMFGLPVRGESTVVSFKHRPQ
jgi:2OG-Fe(II) oxygenase superfamily